MFRTYVHLAEKEIDAEFLSKSRPRGERGEPIRCTPADCLPEMPHTQRTGDRLLLECGQGLSEEAAAEEGELDMESARRAKDMIDYLQHLIDSGDLPQPK
ncbi:hypothetical protein [Methanosphaerula palustris]|uniref:hypothetical protein n=1 Tax=Methanosphaerula palustris TaxID=475088 RepID=UPI000322D6F2|nr:hypothetical protein [Methanosphaerula palustris]